MLFEDKGNELGMPAKGCRKSTYHTIVSAAEV